MVTDKIYLDEETGDTWDSEEEMREALQDESFEEGAIIHEYTCTKTFQVRIDRHLEEVKVTPQRKPQKK